MCLFVEFSHSGALPAAFHMDRGNEEVLERVQSSSYKVAMFWGSDAQPVGYN